MVGSFRNPKKEVDDVSEYQNTKEEVDWDAQQANRSKSSSTSTNTKINWNSNRGRNLSKEPDMGFRNINKDNIETICLDSDSDDDNQPLSSIVTKKSGQVSLDSDSEELKDPLNSDSDSASYEGSDGETPSEKEDPFKDFLDGFEAAQIDSLDKKIDETPKLNGTKQSISKTWGQLANGNQDSSEKENDTPDKESFTEEKENKLSNPEDFASAWSSGKGQKSGIFGQPLLGQDSPKNVRRSTRNRKTSEVICLDSD